jgi:hypothetical protein
VKSLLKHVLAGEKTAHETSAARALRAPYRVSKPSAVSRLEGPFRLTVFSTK